MRRAPLNMLGLGLSGAALHMANRLVTLGTGIILARGLGAEGYGTYAFAFAMMGLLILVAEWGMPTLVLREASRAVAARDWPAFGAMARGAPLLVLCIAAGVSLAGAGAVLLWPSAGTGAYGTALGLMFVLLPLTALLKVGYSLLKALQAVSLGQFCELLLSQLVVLALFTAFLVFLPGRFSAEAALALQILTALIAAPLVALFILRRLPARAAAWPGRGEMALWLRRAAPFILAGAAMVVNTRADILMIGWLRDSADVGIYRVAAQGAVLAGLALQIVQGTYSPRFALLHAEGRADALRALYRAGQLAAAAGALACVALFYFFGRDLLGLVFGAEYLPGYAPLVILALGYLGNAAFGPVGILCAMTGRERLLARILWLAAGGNIVLNLVLIPLAGTTGAAVATALTVTGYHLVLYLLVRGKTGPGTLPAGRSPAA